MMMPYRFIRHQLISTFARLLSADVKLSSRSGALLDIARHILKGSAMWIRQISTSKGSRSPAWMRCEYSVG
jgi:hypothetical protein